MISSSVYKQTTRWVALALVSGVMGCGGSSDVGSVDLSDKEAVKKGMSGGSANEEVKTGKETYKSIKNRPSAPEAK